MTDWHPVSVEHAHRLLIRYGPSSVRKVAEYRQHGALVMEWHVGGLTLVDVWPRAHAGSRHYVTTGHQPINLTRKDIQP